MTEKTKLLFIIRPASGGMKKHVVDLVNGLNKDLYQITVISAPNEALEKELDHGIKFETVGMADQLSPGQDMNSILYLKLLISKYNPDLIHIHGNKSSLIGRLAARKFNIPIVITVHNFLTYQNSSFVKRKVSSFIEKSLSKKTSKIITVSKKLKDNLVDIEGLEASKITVIHNGIAPMSLPQEKVKKSAFGLSDGDFTIINVGRMVPFKGQKYLIEAFSKISGKYPDLKLLIVGNGPLKDELKQLSIDLGVEESVKFPENVENINEIYSLGDMFVLPSIDEPFGLVVLEAMSAKLPIVATASGGVVEILTDKEDGLLVKPADSDGLAQEIEKLYLDADLQKKLVINAEKTFNDKFTLEKMIEKTTDIYRKVLSGTKES